MRAAFFALNILLLLEFFKCKVKKEFLIILTKGLTEAPKVVVPITVACACAGIVVGIIQLTGLGQRISSMILIISGTNLIVFLFLIMILAIVLGMGMPTSSAYIIMASLLAPSMVRMGIPLISAHMYVFYFACLSSITPPIALASYAAAGIARASPGKVGILAFYLGLAAYIVPYMFIYGPSLLFIVDDYFVLITTIITAVFGIFSLGSSVQGWLFGKINNLQRILLFATALLLIKPGLLTDTIGIIILLAMGGLKVFYKGKINKRK
jgi:TRAP-type uncharacterized transport system fused permease subunit